VQEKSLFVILQSFPQAVIEEDLKRLREVCNHSNEGEEIYVGISPNDYGILSLARSYKRALAVLRIAKKQNKPQLHYNNMGINQLLIEVEDMKVLKKFYDDTIGKLENYDIKNQTNYVEILKKYIDKNNSVEQVAKETYVHRNTINYKIKKIKEILECELNYKDILNLVLAFHIKEYL
jgi:DNA-binding PucR family transcriptional regulator